MFTATIDLVAVAAGIIYSRYPLAFLSLAHPLVGVVALSIKPREDHSTTPGLRPNFAMLAPLRRIRAFGAMHLGGGFLCIDTAIVVSR